MNEDSPRGIQPSHLELKAQYVEPGLLRCGHVPMDVIARCTTATFDCFHVLQSFKKYLPSSQLLLACVCEWCTKPWKGIRENRRRFGNSLLY